MSKLFPNLFIRKVNIFFGHYYRKCAVISIFNFICNKLILASSLQIMSFIKEENNVSSVSAVVGILNHKFGRYNSVIINSDDDLCQSREIFCSKLKYSLQKWNSDGVNIIWFHVSRRHSNLVPILVENDFIYHRVGDFGESIILYCWLPKDKLCTVPIYAHTMIGVGCIVVNNKNELLVVLQRYGSKEMWKLPGGYVEHNEDLDIAAVREVEEETGIKTEFSSSILFRHTHHANFDCSDLYFVMQLKPVSYLIRANNEEVIEAKWMLINEFLNHPKVHELNRSFVKIFLENRQNNVSMAQQKGLHPVTKLPYSLYTIEKNNEENSHNEL